MHGNRTSVSSSGYINILISVYFFISDKYVSNIAIDGSVERLFADADFRKSHLIRLEYLKWLQSADLLDRDLHVNKPFLNRS